MTRFNGETIVAAAILIDGKVWTLPAPARHHDVIRHYREETSAERLPENDQGFVSSNGRFLRRKAALAIAFEADQVTDVTGTLTSEDLW